MSELGGTRFANGCGSILVRPKDGTCWKNIFTEECIVIWGHAVAHDDLEEVVLCYRGSSLPVYAVRLIAFLEAFVPIPCSERQR